MVNTAFEYFFYTLSKLHINDIIFSMKIKNMKNSNFIILAYHKTPKEAFLEHMLYLEKKYSIISFDDFFNQFKQKKYPSDPTFVITFDDGFDNFYTDIYPVCREISVPAMVYITTENVVNREPFWWEELDDLNKLGIKLSWDILSKKTSIERKKLISEATKIINYSKREGESLTKEHIVEMKNYKEISFGSHTATHTNLASESEEKTRSELKNSKSFLEELIRRPINHFAYPNTQYSKEIKSLLQETGYNTAVTVPDAYVAKNDDFFEIPRIGAGPYGCSKYWLESRIAGIFNFYKIANNF
jgi:peptidoglycan/xylan/chitin deacetylase (PgdA/CDA1 family)